MRGVTAAREATEGEERGGFVTTCDAVLRGTVAHTACTEEYEG